MRTPTSARRLLVLLVMAGIALVPATQEYSESLNRVRVDCQMQAAKKK